jgi:hypothetical protein
MADEPVTQEPTADEVTEVIQEVQHAATNDDPNVPVEVKLASGQIYKGKNQQEVIDQLVKAQENASAKITSQAETLNQLQQTQVEVAKEGEYSDNEYYRLWALPDGGPKKAQSYLNSFDAQYKQLQTAAEQTRKTGELDNFKANVGWVPTPDEAAAFASEFAISGMKPTALNLEVVFGRMQRAGTIGGVAPTRRTPPQGLGVASPGTKGDIDMVEFGKLPADQMREVIEKLSRQ